MPSFLSDPEFSVYLAIAAVFLITGTVWFNTRSRQSLTVLGAVVLVGGLVLLIDYLYESTREEAVRRAQAMIKAADTRDPEAFLAHIADKFEYRGEGGPKTITRDELRHAHFWSILKTHDVHVAAWDFARTDVEHINDDTVEIGFLAKGEGGGKQFPMYFRATFARQADGQMKLVAIASFDPLKRVNERKSIPYFP